MTSHALRNHLSYCQVDGRPLFLDTHNDRYFRLSGELETAFLRYTRGTGTQAAIRKLIEHNILTEIDDAPAARRPQLQPPRRSALETPPLLDAPTESVATTIFLEVLATVYWMQVQLRTRRLAETLNDIEKCHHRANPPRSPSEEERLLRSANTFMKARRLVPLETRCLVDSLSITRFLARRGFLVSIVFGVTAAPFTAHCWVQSGATVLNDTLGNARTYTIIRVI